MSDLDELRSVSRSSELPSSDLMLGRTVLLVRDFDEAAAFYQAAFGARIIHDEMEGAQRLLHLGFPGQGATALAPVGLWLLQAGEDEAALVGRQAGNHPFLVLYTADLDFALARLTRAGGTVRGIRRDEGSAAYAHVQDLYGNRLVLVESNAASTRAR